MERKISSFNLCGNFFKWGDIGKEFPPSSLFEFWQLKLNKEFNLDFIYEQKQLFEKLETSQWVLFDNLSPKLTITHSSSLSVLKIVIATMEIKKWVPFESLEGSFVILFSLENSYIFFVLKNKDEDLQFERPFVIFFQPWFN